jgi:hypothetical protein
MEAGVLGYALWSGGERCSSESDSEGVCRNLYQLELSKHLSHISHSHHIAPSVRHCG